MCYDDKCGARSEMLGHTPKTYSEVGAEKRDVSAAVLEDTTAAKMMLQ